MTYKTELARRYFPHLAPKQAIRQLSETICYTPELEQELASVGYSRSNRRRYFFDNEVAIIEKYLGGGIT